MKEPRNGVKSFKCSILQLLQISCWFLVISVPVTNAISLNCDPCITRKDYTLKAILHGTAKDDFWLQVQSAMHQAALDMGVGLELQLRETFNSFAMAQEIDAASRNPDYDALIVTIPDELVQQSVSIAIQEQEKPIFGMNLGYEVARKLGVLGFASQDEFVAGSAAADEFLRHGNITKAVFVNNDPSNSGYEARYEGFKEVLAPVTFDPTQPSTQVDIIRVDPSNEFTHVTDIQNIFSDCPYDAVLLGGAVSLDVAVAALESNNCIGTTLLGSFDETPELISEIVNGRVAFGVSQQPYLQAVLPVYFAAIYVTTGKALALPVEERVYLSGPFIINSDNVPSDTLQECAADAFPVCPSNLDPNGDVAKCACTDRSTIRIGGVLHGVTTDVFWDPVFASAKQAAIDMGIDLDLIRFQPAESDEDVHHRMAARIKTLCEGGVDGIFLSIPSDIVIDSVKRCLELQVPVVSVNAGGEASEELQLMNHIGMLEFSAGYGGAQRLIEAGMKEGYCLNHAPQVEVTKQRCQGFEAAIVEHGGDVVYKGEIEVPMDNTAQYQFVVEEFVATDGDWAGLGLLLLGPTQIEPYRSTLGEKHPAAIVGAFDINEDLLNALKDGAFIFGIDQQPYLQGNMPVILLALQVYTKQVLKNHFVETGPHFVEEVPTPEAQVCEANFFEVCPDRPEEDMNYIPEGLVAFVYVLFGLLLFVSFVATAWTHVYREKWVVKISQPVFLYLMLFGIVLSSLSIPFLNVETAYPYLQDDATGQLTDVENPDITKANAACMLVPWFYGLGFAVTFSAIFAKIQRVKLIYLAGINMQRKRVTIRDVMNIMIVMLGIEFALLLAWQLTSPYKWERTVTQEEDGFPVESVGSCSSESGSYFFLGIILFQVMCLVYALILSWQTKDINSEFAESSYLFLAVMFMFQVQCLAVPILALVKDSPDVFVFVQAIAIFLQNFTVLVLIFGPKMYKVFVGQADPSGTSVSGRTNNPRFSLTNRPAGTREGRTSILSASGAFQRTESSDRDGSAQFMHPMTVTFQEDGSGGNGDQFRRIPGEKTSSFRRSTDVWMSSENKNSSEVSPLSLPVRTNSIREESIIEEGESKELVVVDMSSILEITDTTPREDAKDDILTPGSPLPPARDMHAIPEESTIEVAPQEAAIAVDMTGTVESIKPQIETTHSEVPANAATIDVTSKDQANESTTTATTTRGEELPVTEAPITGESIAVDPQETTSVTPTNEGQESKGVPDLISEPSDVVSA